MNETLTDELAPLLCGRFGAPLRHLSDIDSTNLEALRWAVEGAPEGACVVADQQRVGRGRWGRTWDSRPGSALMFSIVLRPRAEGLDLLTTTVGVAVTEAVREVAAIDARLKWPNDVVVDDRKLAGILVESQSAGADVDFAVAGIGINLDLSGGFLIPEVGARATSLAQLVADPPRRVEVLAAVLSWLEPLYDGLSTGEGAAEVIRLATERSAVLGREVNVRYPDGRLLTGTARGILSTGALEIENSDGVAQIRSGEVELLRPQVGPQGS